MHHEKEIQIGRVASGQTRSTPRNTLSTGLTQMTAVTAQSVQGRDIQPPTASPPLLQRSKPSKRSPIPGIIIPNLGHHIGRAVWQDAIQQWEKGDADNDLPALKDWPKEWYTGERWLVYGSKRRTRQIIAEEYERLVSWFHRKRYTGLQLQWTRTFAALAEMMLNLRFCTTAIIRWPPWLTPSAETKTTEASSSFENLDHQTSETDTSQMQENVSSYFTLTQCNLSP